MCSLLVALGNAKPNRSRLRTRIQQSKKFIKGTKAGTHKLSLKTRRELEEALPDLQESEEIISDGSILPEILFEETRRTYLVRVVKQINASYENHIYDACALMMRRLLEILLILAFQHQKISSEIEEEDGGYSNLKTLINKAISNPSMSLSSKVRRSINDFRELGNLSAHRITYNCRRDDIRPIRLEYRAVIEELLYKAGLKK